jgi:hypothetical protein
MQVKVSIANFTSKGFLAVEAGRSEQTSEFKQTNYQLSNKFEI